MKSNYQIFKKINVGKSNTVYLAINKNINQLCIIKEANYDLKNYHLNYDRLLHEAKILSQLSHESIPKLIEVIHEDSSVKIVLSYTRGKTLYEIVKQNGLLSCEKVNSLVYKICKILLYLHTRSPQIIYCDLKPENVIVQPDSKISLIDFDSAFEYNDVSNKYTFGTKGYASPEQYKSTDIDSRTDIYSLGAIMIFLLTGKKPENLQERYKLIKSKSEKLADIIFKCMQAEPEKRYKDIQEIIDSLKQI